MSSLSARVSSLQHRPKTRAACAALEAMARALGPDVQLPTVVELRQQLGAGASTLHDALRELENRGVLYRKHGVGIFTASPQVRHVALVCNPLFWRGGAQSPFWDLLFERARERAVRHDEKLSLHLTLPGSTNGVLQSELLRSMERGKVQGAIGLGLSGEEAEIFVSHEVPYVAFAGAGQFLTVLDGEELVRLGARALQNRGCGRIGFWSATLSQPFEQKHEHSEGKKFEMFARRVAGELEIPIEASDVQDNLDLANGNPAQWPSPQEQGFETAKRVFGAPNAPDGVIISNDLMAHGALVAFREMRLQVGVDVQVAAHCNRGSHVLMGYERELIQLEYDPAEVADQLFTTLETLMNGEVPRENVGWVRPQLRGA